MLVIVLGEKGSGKTLLTTLFSYFSSKPNIFSNYTMKIKKVQALTLGRILDVSHNADLMIDEAYIWLESRTSTSKINIFLSNILMQSRKREIDIYLTAQLNSMIDLRFRSESDLYIQCRSIWDNYILIGFEYIVLDKMGNENEFFLSGNDAEQYFFNLYDTYQIIPPHNLHELEYSVMTPQEQILLAERLSIIIYPDLRGNITHDRVIKKLKKIGYKTPTLARDVYTECKDIQSDGKEKRIANLKYMKKKLPYTPSQEIYEKHKNLEKLLPSKML